MSAFTNWNGPGDCCGGGGINSIPQIQELSKLVTIVTQLQNTITGMQTDLSNVISAYDTHASTPTAEPVANSSGGNGAPHAKIQDAISKALASIATLNTTIGTIASGSSVSSLLGGKVTKATMDGAALESAIASKLEKGTYTGTAATLATAIEDKMAKGATGQYQTVSEIKDDIDDVQEALNNLIAVWSASDLYDLPSLPTTLKSNACVLELYASNLQLNWLINYNNWKDSNSILTVASKIEPVNATGSGNTSSMPYIICELLYLSKYSNVSGTLSKTSYNDKKPGRVYVRTKDSNNWSAIIDAVCAAKTDNTGVVGALTAVATKTAGIGDIKFGLYSGTAKGEEHIYIGVVHKNVTTGSPLNPAMHFCGVNVAQVNNAPVNGLNILAETDWITGTGGTAFAEIHVSKIYSDNYYDASGNNVAVTKGDTLVIGNDSHETIIVSNNRPPVTDDEGDHQLAYLSDLHNSIVWQRAVKVYTETLNELNTATVAVTGTAPNYVVVKDGDSNTRVPGIYLTQHAASYNGPVTGYIFQADDVALVKESTLPNNTQQLADGKVNVTLSTSNTVVQAANFIGFPDRSVIKVGTTVVDNVGAYGRVVSGPDLSGAYTISSTGVSLYTYKKPMYAEFNGTTWVAKDNIDIPEATDGYISPLTYEWSGHHLSVLHPTDDYYTPSYIMWTAHYQNQTTMNWVDTEEWSFIDITLAGVRDAAQQDVIDRALQGIGETQPDYANFQSTKVTQVPGQPISVQPDPSYIHNKPWVGLAILEGGGFNQPSYQSGWMVDGGEYTGMAGIVRNPAIAPPVSPDDSFRNVLIKVLHGKYEDMPEVKMLTDGSTVDTQNAIRANYAWQLRICADSADPANDGLYYSDGQTVYKITGTAI